MYLKKWLLIALFCSFAAWANDAPDYRFTLQGEHGTVQDSDFKDQYLLLTFGYSSCPDVCPLTLYELSQVMKQLTHPERVQVVFVSIDSQAETPQQVARYAQYFHPDFVGLSGDHADLKAMAKRYGASFGFRVGEQEVEPPNLPEKYSVYHSALVYLISPQRTRLETFAYQVKPETMAKVINKHIQ